MKKSTFALIAEKAQVGIATVDRVINERGGVSPKTAQKVIKTARELGINRILPDVYQAPWQIEVILSTNPTQFFKYLTQYFTKIAQGHQYHNLRLRCTLMPENEPQKLAGHIVKSADMYDGIIVFANDNVVVYEALEASYNKKTPLITLATDLPNSKRLCHVGIDQFQIGRTAASLLSKMIFQPGEILMISGRFDYQAHIQRMKGFQDFFKGRQEISLSNIFYGNDDRRNIYSILEEHKNENIIGIYNSGAGNQAIGDWLIRRKQNAHCAFVTHELYDTTEVLLANKTLAFTLDQNAQRHAELSLDIMLNHLANNYHPDTYLDGKVPFSIFTEENMN